MIKLDHLTFAIFDALGETDSWPGNGSMKKREMSDFCERSAFGQERTLTAQHPRAHEVRGAATTF